jgi:hypothetical protein
LFIKTRLFAKNCADLIYYAAIIGKLVPTFLDNISILFFGDHEYKMGPIGYLETSVRNAA